MELKKIPLLTTDDIEVKIKQITKTGAIALLYKTARVDYRILDEVFGPLGWQIDYQEIKGNLYCTVSLWDKDNKQWVRKTNCGIESRSDDEGNEKKGEASDAAKRAGFVVGIGNELYSAPFIFMEVATQPKKEGKGYELADPWARYVVTDIKYNEETRVITSLTIANEKTGVVVYQWTMPSSGAKAKKMGKTTGAKAEKPAEAPAAKPAAEPQKAAPAPSTKPAPESASKEPKMPLKDVIKNIGLIAKKMSTNTGNIKPYLDIVTEVSGDASFKCSHATEEQYDTVLKIYNTLVQRGYDN